MSREPRATRDSGRLAGSKARSRKATPGLRVKRSRLEEQSTEEKNPSVETTEEEEVEETTGESVAERTNSQASGKLAKEDCQREVYEDAGNVSESLLKEYGVATLFGTSERCVPPSVVQLQPGETVPLSDIKDRDWIELVKFWTFRDAYRLMHSKIWVEHCDLVRWVWTYSDYKGSDPLVIANIVFNLRDRSKGMLKDLMLMCIIFMEKGNNVTKIIDRASPE